MFKKNNIKELVIRVKQFTLCSFGANANIAKDKDTITKPSNAVFISDARHTAANTAAFNDITLYIL